jgi:hypothetical protein
MRFVQPRQTCRRTSNAAQAQAAQRRAEAQPQRTRF